MNLSEGVAALAGDIAQEINALRAEIADLRSRIEETHTDNGLYPSASLYPSTDLYPQGV